MNPGHDSWLHTCCRATCAISFNVGRPAAFLTPSTARRAHCRMLGPEADAAAMGSLVSGGVPLPGRVRGGGCRLGGRTPGCQRDAPAQERGAASPGRGSDPGTSASQNAVTGIPVTAFSPPAATSTVPFSDRAAQQFRWRGLWLRGTGSAERHSRIRVYVHLLRMDASVHLAP